MVQVLHLLVTQLQEKNGLFGEFLTNAQGEDVVAGYVLRCTFPKWKRNSRKLSFTVQERMRDSGETLQRYAGHGVYSRAR